MTNLIMFTEEEELSELTGLNHDQLLNAGFDLDDFSVGFCSGKQPMTYSVCSNESTYEDPVIGCEWLFHRMETYCCGYKYVEYDGNHYYMVYHS